MSGALAACSQKINAGQVPDAIKNALVKAHPRAKALWVKEDENYEANFKENGKVVSCVINGKGIITETETGIAVDKLPVSVLSYVKDHYKGKTIKEAAMIVKDNGEVNYEAAIKGMDLIFDANGKFIKEAKTNQ